MKFNGLAWKLMTIVVRKPLEKKYGKGATRKYIRKSKPICKQMFKDVDDIGRGNPMIGNIYGAFPLMAIWKAADGTITPDDYAEVIKVMLENPLVKKHMGKTNLNRHEDREKVRESYRSFQRWAEEHPAYRNHTWDFHFDDAKPEYGIYYHFTRCPLNTFARKHGYLEILPVMCNMDYQTAALRHATLHRKQTLASGGTMCDYWYVGDEHKESYE